MIQILKTLNSNCETPYLIWDNGTRVELIDFLETQRQMRPEDGAELDYGSDFLFTAHSGELRIGGIFIRIYNEQPTFQIEVYNIISAKIY